jgi:hypothetical protein
VLSNTEEVVNKAGRKSELALTTWATVQ